jgi:hypothetical protein
MDGEAKAFEKHITMYLKKKNKNNSRVLWIHQYQLHEKNKKNN